jgi:hypothetical protein
MIPPPPGYAGKDEKKPDDFKGEDISGKKLVTGIVLVTVVTVALLHEAVK